jgi:hypothetical protein
MPFEGTVAFCFLNKLLTQKKNEVSRLNMRNFMSENSRTVSDAQPSNEQLSLGTERKETTVQFQ